MILCRSVGKRIFREASTFFREAFTFFRETVARLVLGEQGVELFAHAREAAAGFLRSPRGAAARRARPYFSDFIYFSSFSFLDLASWMIWRGRERERPATTRIDDTASRSNGSSVGRRMNIELNFPPNFEGLVLGCIDADFCK